MATTISKKRKASPRLDLVQHGRPPTVCLAPCSSGFLTQAICTRSLWQTACSTPS